jgi:hypothetical protein
LYKRENLFLLLINLSVGKSKRINICRIYKYRLGIPNLKINNRLLHASLFIVYYLFNIFCTRKKKI